jgi:hypothetical protein
MSATDKDAPVASGSGRRPAGDEDGGFLSRWSQRKRAVQQEREREDARLAPEAEAEKAAEEARVREENQSAAEAVDMETLSFESDYSVFLKEGVSKHLKNAALQKLWRSNPVLACVDGLNDYDQDFRTVETLTEGLKTSWQVGNGYGWMDEQKKSESAAQAVADAEVPPLDPAAGETPAVAGTLKGEDGEPGAGPDTRSGSDDQTDTGDGQPPVTLMWREDRGLLGAPVDDEVMALGLAADGLVDGGGQQLVAFRRAQRRAQVGGVVLAEAHVERAGAGQAHAVAAFAEIVGHRRDEAERPPVSSTST